MSLATPCRCRVSDAGCFSLERCFGCCRHYGQWLADILPSMIDAVVVAKGELCIVVTPPAITHVMTFLRDHSNCQVRSPLRIQRL